MDKTQAQDYLKGVLGRQPTAQEVGGGLSLESLIPLIEAIVTDVVTNFLRKESAAKSPQQPTSPGLVQSQTQTPPPGREGTN